MQVFVLLAKIWQDLTRKYIIDVLHKRKLPKH